MIYLMCPDVRGTLYIKALIRLLALNEKQNVLFCKVCK